MPAFLFIWNLSEACRGLNLISTKTRVLTYATCAFMQAISSHAVISVIRVLSRQNPGLWLVKKGQQWYKSKIRLLTSCNPLWSSSLDVKPDKLFCNSEKKKRYPNGPVPTFQLALNSMLIPDMENSFRIWQWMY